MSGQVINITNESEKGDGVVEGLRPHIPPGEYQLAFMRHHTTMFCGAPKVVLRFRVTTMGPYFGIELERFYNARRLLGKVGKNGRFKVGSSSDLVLEFCRVAQDRITRLDRLPLSVMKNYIIKGVVHSVAKNRNQKELPEIMQYSVIRELTGTES